MKTISIIILLIFITLFIGNCSKSPRAHIVVNGVLVSKFKHQPISGADISCWAACDPRDACQEANNIARSRSSEDGTFGFKGRAWWRGNSYTLLITFIDTTSHTEISNTINIIVEKNQTLNLDTLKL